MFKKDRQQKQQEHKKVRHQLRHQTSGHSGENKSTDKEQTANKKYNIYEKYADEDKEISICPSIEKELSPNLSRLTSEQLNYQNIELHNQNILQNQALQKASTMIELLEDQNNDLKSTIQQLQQQIIDKTYQITALENQIKKINHKSHLQSNFRENQSHPIHHVHTSTGKQCYTSNFSIQQQKEKYTSDAFLKEILRSQEKNQQSQSKGIVRRSEKKIINIDHPAYKQYNVSNMSRKYTPYNNDAANNMKNLNYSKHNLSLIGGNMKKDQQNQQQQYVINNILQNISLLIIKQQFDSNEHLMQQLSDMVHNEEQQYEEYVEEVEQKMTEIQEISEYESHNPMPVYGTAHFLNKIKNNYDKINVQKRLFTLEGEQLSSEELSINPHQYQLQSKTIKLQSNAINNKSQRNNIIYQYEICIQNYKEYAAYLKAYLCQSINFIKDQLHPQHKLSFQYQHQLSFQYQHQLSFQYQPNNSHQDILFNKNHHNLHQSKQKNDHRIQTLKHDSRTKSTRNEEPFLSFPFIINNVIADTKNKVNEKVSELRCENKELREIMDGLISNLQLMKQENDSKNSQEKLEDWGDLQYNVMKQLQ